MLGSGMPDDHEKIVNYYQTNNSAGYDLQLHQQVLSAYKGFLDQWNFRCSFPTASSLFYEIGKQSYFFWQKIMENARMCNANDYLTISGWESTTIDNHSGIVDAHRDFRTDPTLLSRAMSPEVLVIRPRRFVLKPGNPAVVDVHLINETGRAGAQLLTITALNPDGSTLFTESRAVMATGGDVFGQLLSANFNFTPNTNGTLRITGVLAPQGGTGGVVTNEADLAVVDPVAGASVLPRVVVAEGDGKVSQVLSNVFGVAPLDTTHLGDPLDAIVVSAGSSWAGTYYSLGIKIPDSAGKLVTIAFHQTAFTHSTGQVWQPYTSLTVSDAQWSAIPNRVATDGVRLVIWPNGVREASQFASKLAGSNILQITSAAGKNGSIGQARGGRRGAWEFLAAHRPLDRAPAHAARGLTYQTPPRRTSDAALLVR